MTIFSTFLESLIHFLSNNLKTTSKFEYSEREKRCQNLTLSELQFEHTVRDKIDCKIHLE